MNQENCPCCPNHCPKDNLGCGRGKDYFNNLNNSLKSNSLNEKVIMDLRKCGHLLHHNRDLNTDELLVNLSKDELIKLHELLSKICNNDE
jgi:hypothetical protein